MAGTTPVPSTRDVYEHHMAAFEQLDAEALLADYTDDSVIISNMGTFRGREDIGQLNAQFVEEFSQDGAELVVDETTIDGDIAYMLWHAETPDNVYEFGTDTYIIHDGTIETQTFAAKVPLKQ